MKDVEQRLSWSLTVCVQAKMRLTPIRERILAFLSAQRVPVSLETLTRADDIRGSCDTATVYRTLMLFKELEVIRQVSLPNKISYFVLNIPDESSHFLICRCCGQVTELPAVESVVALERELTDLQGYAGIYHELEFFGVCPACQQQPTRVVCAKIPVRATVTSHPKPFFAKGN